MLAPAAVTGCNVPAGPTPGPSHPGGATMRRFGLWIVAGGLLALPALRADGTNPRGEWRRARL